MADIRIVRIPVDGVPVVETVDRDDLGWMQRTVGGYIEILNVGTGYLVVNEEGKLQRLPVNPTATRLVRGRDVIVGQAFLVGPEDEDGNMTSVPDGLASDAVLAWEEPR